MQVSPDYMTILDEVMEKWLGPGFDNHDSYNEASIPYRMMALLLDDPWVEPCIQEGTLLLNYERAYIVDINKPEIQRKLDMLNGPYFNTIMKMLELRAFNEDCERNHDRTKNSSRTLV